MKNSIGLEAHLKDKKYNKVKAMDEIKKEEKSFSEIEVKFPLEKITKGLLENSKLKLKCELKFNKEIQINNIKISLNIKHKTIIPEDEPLVRNAFRNNIIYLIIIIHLMQIILSNNNLQFIKYKFSNITLKINGIGNKKVITSYHSYYTDSRFCPNMIYINGVKQSSIKSWYYLNETYNFVEIIWNRSITYSEMMFRGCEDINEIDLSNFNTSMVIDMKYIFYNCSNLEYINLINFKEKSNTSVEGIFDYVPDNVLICLNEKSNKILAQIKNITCYTIDCSYNWKIKQKKIVNKTGLCIDNSNNDIKRKIII